MPRVTIYGLTESGKEASFSISGICFAILGKTESRLENIYWMLTKKGIHQLKTLKWTDVSPARKCLDAIQYVFDTYDFMRTCISTPEEIVESNKAVFDIENYTLNEVMHAIFHLRSMSTLERIFNSDISNGEFFKKATSSGMHPAYAYALSMMPPIGDFKRTRTSSVETLKPISREKGHEHIWSNDSNCFNFRLMDLNRYLDICSGKYQKDPSEYEGGTLQENLGNQEKYIQNMSKYGAIEDRAESSGLGGEFGQIYLNCVQNALDKRDNLPKESTFGLIASRSANTYGHIKEVDVYERLFKNFKHSLDLICFQKGIPTLEERVNA